MENLLASLAPALLSDMLGRPRSMDTQPTPTPPAQTHRSQTSTLPDYSPAANSNSSANSSRQTPTMSTDNQTSLQHLPTSPSVVAVPMQDLSVARLPFRFHWVSITPTDSALQFSTLNLAASTQLTTLAALFRRAKLTKLCARIEPTLSAVSTPFTAYVAWTAANAAPAEADIQNIPGARTITYTNVTSGNADNTAIEAPLQAMNPMVKDSVAYVDTPFFSLAYVASGTLSPTVLANVLFEGEIEVSHATITALPSA